MSLPLFVQSHKEEADLSKQGGVGLFRQLGYCYSQMVHSLQNGCFYYFAFARNRVAQIVGTWERRSEKVEEERENGRKWREREREREIFLSIVLFHIS